MIANAVPNTSNFWPSLINTARKHRSGLMQKPSLINMFWIGKRLGWIPRLSMSSFVANGHEVHLHAYDEIEDVPTGVHVQDAAQIANQSAVMALTGGRRGTTALAADYFRLLLQQKGAGVWCDTDVISIRPFSFPLDVPVYGLQTPDEINNAVLYLPPDSPILTGMLKAFRSNHVPPWVDRNRSVQLWLKKLAFQTFGPTDLHWGTLGPASLTWFARRHKQFALAAPSAVFYPYGWRQASEPFAPGTSVASYVTEQTLTIHLYNEVLGELKQKPPPQVSAIGELLRMYAS